MIWFENGHTGDTVCIETTCLADIRIQTVLDNGFFLYRKWRDPNPHSHLNYELYYAEQGSCTAVCDGKIYTCGTGEFLFIPIGAEHHVHTLSAEASIYSFRFSLRPETGEMPGTCAGLLRSLEDPLILSMPESIPLLHQIRWELAQALPLSDEIIRGYLQVFYSGFLRQLQSPGQAAQPAETFSVKLTKKLPGYRENIPQEFYIDLLDEFFTHLPTEHATLADLSARLYLSVSQTQRLVKSHYGISFRQKLMKAKIEKSKWLMLTTELSLEEISQKVGYRSYNAFFDAFLAQTGTSPFRYRQDRL